MKYRSTTDPHTVYGFRDAVLKGLPDEGGLFVPAEIPRADVSLLDNIDSLSTGEIAFQLLHPFVGQGLNNSQLAEVIDQTFTFDIPLKKAGDSGIRILELFHGPTWAFKDVGVRFLAGCLAAWNEQDNTIILVATSGDTGGAVASGFSNQPGVKVVILYPKDKISPLQETQITGPGRNINSFAVEGTFDDCQRMVKSAFGNEAIRKKVNLISANSINIARWLPQTIFYALAWREMRRQGLESMIGIPAGNYGNVAAAFLAHNMGFYFSEILAAHNANNTIPLFLKTGMYNPGKTIATLANAMDVNDPGNFDRLRYLQKHQQRGNETQFSAASVSDEDIIHTIQDVWKTNNYLLDPHTATAWNMLTMRGGKGIIMATAHPGKFEGVIRQALGYYPKEWIKSWQDSLIRRTEIPADASLLQDILLKLGRKSL